MSKGKRNRKKEKDPKSTLKEKIGGWKGLQAHHRHKVESLQKKIDRAETELKEIASA